MANNPMRPRNNPTTPGKPATQTPAPEQTATDQQTVATTETPGNKAVIETDTPAPTLVEENTVEAGVDAEPMSDEDSDLVAQFNRQLAAFVKAAEQPGTVPEDFVEQARIVQMLTRFVIRTPRLTILDALLAFFVDHADDVAAERVYLKGVSTLPNMDQQQITHLHTLFIDMAQRRATRVANTQILQVLKKPEILNYYNRKVAAIRQSA